jgi:putative phage-type endonuclease
MNHLVDFDRAGRLTASQAAAALGLSPYTNRKELWRQLTGKKPPFEGNVYTQYGNDNESEALATLEAKLGVILDPGRFVAHPIIEWLGASPDSFLDGGIIEVKCPQTIHPHAPEHYRAQMMVQMDCCQTDHGWFGSWTPQDMMVERVVFDNEWYFGYILPGLDVFWNKYVKQDIEPPRGKFNKEKELQWD